MKKAKKKKKTTKTKAKTKKVKKVAKKTKSVKKTTKAKSKKTKSKIVKKPKKSKKTTGKKRGRPHGSKDKKTKVKEETTKEDLSHITFAKFLGYCKKCRSIIMSADLESKLIYICSSCGCRARTNTLKKTREIKKPKNKTEYMEDVIEAEHVDMPEKVTTLDDILKKEDSD